MQKCLVLTTYELSTHKQQLLKETYREFLNLIEEHRAVTGRASTDNELHHLTYKSMREKHYSISAQLIEQARRIAWKTRKQGKPKKCTVRFDRRLFSMSETKRGNPVLSLRLAKKRVGLPVAMYQRIKDHLALGWKLTSVIMTSKMEFNLVMNKEDPPTTQTQNILGIDVNASKIAVSIISGNRILKQLYLGKEIGSTQYEFEERRTELQKYRDTTTTTTPSKAGLKLKRLSGKQRRYVRTNIWTLANELVGLAKKYHARIAIEALKHLRRRKGPAIKKVKEKDQPHPVRSFEALPDVCMCKGRRRACTGQPQAHVSGMPKVPPHIKEKLGWIQAVSLPKVRI